MSKQTKSQWDFGELFPAETTRRVLTVSELTSQVKRLLEKELGLVWVTGEVTNLRAQSSGHIYFTLKDSNAQLNCVLFRGVLHVIQRRNPGLEIIFVPCRVQGDGAAEEIAASIRLLNEFAAPVEPLKDSPVEASAASTRQPVNPSTHLDLILLTRGGGSLEDLWAFNEETVARAIFESAVPVVSAVGHEIDFTISDFVADVRAATPSVAAEIITEDVFASRQFVAEAPRWMAQRIHRRLDREAENFSQWLQRLTRLHPSRRLNEKLQLLDDLQAGLLRRVKQRWRQCQEHWQNSHQ